jgi:glucokinase
MAHPHTQLILAGDIGGTKVRLGVFEATKGRPVEVVSPESYPSRSAPDFESHIEHFLDQHQIASENLCACFGLAGPVMAGNAKVTNLPWEVSEAGLRKRFAWTQVHLVNDLVATALAIPVLASEELAPLNQAEPAERGHVAVIAAGTGLGKALVAVGRHEMVPVASEGGHADFAPGDPAQMRLWRHLHQRFGHVSQERLLSGDGLINIYNWLRDAEKLPVAASVEQALNDPQLDPARIITENSLARQSAICHQTLATFVTILGAVAGDRALETLPWGGVYLAGGIAPKILPALRQGDFMAAFCAKGRFDKFMARFPVRVILNDGAALLGAVRWALMVS